VLKLKLKIIEEKLSKLKRTLKVYTVEEEEVTQTFASQAPSHVECRSREEPPPCLAISAPSSKAGRGIASS
jgi:hypothetical protein